MNDQSTSTKATTPMRIAQVITRGDEMYGAQKHVLDLSLALADCGHEVTILSGVGGPLDDAVQGTKVTFRLVPALLRDVALHKEVVALRNLTNLFTEMAPDIVATHSSKAGLLGRVAAHRAGIPCTFTAHGWSFEPGIPQPRRTVFRQLERFAGQRTDHFIAVSEAGRSLGIEAGVARSDQISVIPYGVPDIGGSDDLRSTEGPVVLAMAAGFREQKDHQTLFDALTRLGDLDWRLELLGDGPLQDDVEAMVRDRQLGERVNFAGMVPSVAPYFQRAHIKVLATHWEGLPISILEAMTCSLPVVASDVAGVSEQVIDGSTGFVVPPKDPDALATALRRLITDADMRETFGAASRLLYEDRFGVAAMRDRTLEIYDRIRR